MPSLPIINEPFSYRWVPSCNARLRGKVRFPRCYRWLKIYRLITNTAGISYYFVIISQDRHHFNVYLEIPVFCLCTFGAKTGMTELQQYFNAYLIFASNFWIRASQTAPWSLVTSSSIRVLSLALYSTE